MTCIEFTLQTKKTGHEWTKINLDKKLNQNQGPSRQHETKMAKFGMAIQQSETKRTLFEEGIEFVVDRTLRQHMGKRAFDKLKNQQNYSNPQSHHLATPQVGTMPTSSDWDAGEIECLNETVTIKTVTATSDQTVRSALELYLAQEYHRDYADSSCEVGCMTVLVTTACPARIAIIKDSHKVKDGNTFVKDVKQKPGNQKYIVIEIPPYSVLIMDSYLFHAGCRYFEDDNTKRQSHQIGKTISYRSHHYIVPDKMVEPSNETGIKMKWW